MSDPYLPRQDWKQTVNKYIVMQWHRDQHVGKSFAVYANSLIEAVQRATEHPDWTHWFDKVSFESVKL